MLDAEGFEFTEVQQHGLIFSNIVGALVRILTEFQTGSIL
jgi:hypothetical protein